MPKFFFHIGGERPDTAGVELPDRAAARGEAIRTAGEILRDLDGAFSGRQWTMTVEDEEGGMVLELRFQVTEGAQK